MLWKLRLFWDRLEPAAIVFFAYIGLTTQPETNLFEQSVEAPALFSAAAPSCEAADESAEFRATRLHREAQRRVVGHQTEVVFVGPHLA